MGNLESFTLTIPWNLASLVKVSPGIIVHQRHTDQTQTGLLKEQCANLNKGHLRFCCNQVWMKIGGQIPRNAVGIWKGDVLVADLEELETVDASEIYSKRLNAKEVIFPKEGEFIFPIADGQIKTPWRRSRPENIHLDTASTNSRRKSR